MGSSQGRFAALKVRHNIMIAVTVAGLVAAAVGGIGLYKISDVADSAKEMHTRALLPAADAADLRAAVWQFRFFSIGANTTADPALRAGFAKGRDEAATQIDAARQRYAARELDAAQRTAIDDFTADNGATDIIPGSHLWAHRTPQDTEREPVVMKAGSCVFFPGTLWHGGGANRSHSPRLALTAQYCEPWLRPQEAFTLSITRDTVRAVSEDIRRMLGYSIHPPFIGQVDGMHPKRLLEPDASPV